MYSNLIIIYQFQMFIFSFVEACLTVLNEDTYEDYDYNLIRNTLILLINCYNFKRTGIFVDLTIKQVENAIQVDEDNYVINIESGKTIRTVGVANINIMKNHYIALKNFISRVRPLVILRGEQPDVVFLTDKGQPMTSSQTNQYINDIWKLYYTTQRPEDKPPKINFTILRKSAVTGLRKYRATEAEINLAAQHMDHSVKTANTTYDKRHGSGELNYCY